MSNAGKIFAAIAGALVLMAAGAAAMFLVMKGTGGQPAPASPLALVTPTSKAAPTASMSDVAVTIAPDVLDRAGIQTMPATRGASSFGLRIPATVQPNAYRQVVVSSTSAGRVTAVAAELGGLVRQGDPLVTLHSPEVAEIERAAVSMYADLTLAGQQIARLEGLVGIGAASRQELDAARAQQTRVSADLASARARLVLLGRTQAQVVALTNPAAISPLVTLTAPITGTVTARAANPGQTLDSSVELFTIVDLRTVWVVADVFERDIAAVRVGNAVTMTSAASPDAFSGRVTYVDPQVAAETRTARVRVEVPNPGARLRLGMLVDMHLNTPREVVTIPRSAVQTIDSVDVVYVADAKRPGTFIERSVRLGSTSGDRVEVLAGLAERELVVTGGSFLVRSERSRVDTTAPRPAPEVANAGNPSPPAAGSTPSVVTLDIEVTADGFVPAVTHIPSGTPVRLRFTRRVEDTCVTEVVFASLKIRRDLPVNQAVVIQLPPQPPGVLDFACGMKMVKGQIVVDDRREVTR